MPRNRNLIEQWLGEDVPQKKQNIKQDRYDHTIFEEIRSASEKIQTLNNTGTFPELIQDLWAAFYKMHPELEEEEKLNPGHRVNRPFVERLLEDSATKEARITTALDEFSSAVAAAAAGEKIATEIAERADLKKAMDHARASMAVPESEQTDEEKAQAKIEVEKALEKLDGSARDVRRAVREAIQAGREEAEKMQGVLAGWGLEPGDLKYMPIGDRLKIADALTRDSRMKRIADLVGKMRNLARAKQKQKMKHRRDEIHSITIGSELHHILPQELGALRHPLRKLDFYRRFTEGQLLQYDLQSQEKLARGPIVAMIDISGSMIGDPIEWAIAAALALADTARRQKRFCHILFFNAEVKKEFSFTPGEKDPEKYVEMSSIGVSGGTDYAPAIQRAQAVISSQKEYRNADVVMVTDGLCYLDDLSIELIQEWKRSCNISCFAILLEAGMRGTHGGIAELKRWNDRAWQLSIANLTDGGNEIAGELFEEVY